MLKSIEPHLTYVHLEEPQAQPTCGSPEAQGPCDPLPWSQSPPGLGCTGEAGGLGGAGEVGGLGEAAASSHGHVLHGCGLHAPHVLHVHCGHHDYHDHD